VLLEQEEGTDVSSRKDAVNSGPAFLPLARIFEEKNE
jgi:hypothetical protein